MSNPVKLGLVLIAGVVAVFLVISVVKTLLGLLIPLAIVGGIGLVVYGLINRSSLPGGRRYLP